MIRLVIVLLAVLGLGSAQAQQLVGLSPPLAPVTRAQIPTTVLGATTVVLSGFRTANDLGLGAVYSSIGATCPNGLMAIRDSSATCYNLVPGTPQVNVGFFGAYADDGAHTISAGDIAANPQWRGTYAVGTTWDTVAIQEAIYAAFAGTSTPGVINWNNSTSNQLLNKPLYIPVGKYGINKRLTASMQGGLVLFASKGDALLDWVNSSTNDYVWYCDACSYSVFENPSFQHSTAQSFGTQKPVFGLDFSGAFPSALRTQQNTISNLFVSVGINGQGLAISPSGNSAQGDTNQIINPILIGAQSDWAIQIGGSNALNNGVFGGDIQGFQHDGIQVINGNLSVYNFHSENEFLSQMLSTAPVYTQFTTYGADYHMLSQVNGSAPSVINAYRSEANILALSPGFVNGNQGLDITGASTIPNDIIGWGAGTSFEEGTVVNGGSDGRVFMLVDDGGGQWHPISSFVGSVITDSTASYSVNQFQNYNINVRFGSNGFYQECTISSNTATTLTVTAGCSASSQSQYHIVGKTGGGAPAWNSAPVGRQATYTGGLQGFGFTAGSTCVYYPSSAGTALVNDYIAIPNGYTVGSPGSPFFDPLMPGIYVAKITATGACGGTPGGNITVDRPPNVSHTGQDQPGYTGTPISDGTQGLQWLDLEFIAAGPAQMQNVTIGQGLVVTGGDIRNVINNSIRPQNNMFTQTFGAAPTAAPAGLLPLRQIKAATGTAVASPAGPNSLVAFTMQGLAGAITPTKTGIVTFTVCGTITEAALTTAGNGIKYQVSFGTGTAPTSNAALTGTQIGPVAEYMLANTVTAADVFVPFCQVAATTNLLLGTTYWADLAAEAVGATGFALSNVSILAIEN